MTRKSCSERCFPTGRRRLRPGLKKERKESHEHVKQCMVRQIGCSAEEATVLVRLFFAPL